MRNEDSVISQRRHHFTPHQPPRAKTQDPRRPRTTRPKIFPCVRTANMGVYRFLSTEPQNEIGEGWFRADKNYPKKPCCHLRPDLDLSEYRPEERSSDADGEGSRKFGAHRPRGTEPTSRWLMRLVGLHAGMTTPVARCCGAGLGAAGRLGGIKVGDTRPPRRAASGAVSEDSGCGGPPARRWVACDVHAVRDGGRISVCCCVTPAHKTLQ